MRLLIICCCACICSVLAALWIKRRNEDHDLGWHSIAPEAGAGSPRGKLKGIRWCLTTSRSIWKPNIVTAI
jgi:hypothetical protein